MENKKLHHADVMWMVDTLFQDIAGRPSQTLEAARVITYIEDLIQPQPKFEDFFTDDVLDETFGNEADTLVSTPVKVKTKAKKKPVRPKNYINWRTGKPKALLNLVVSGGTEVVSYDYLSSLIPFKKMRRAHLGNRIRETAYQRGFTKCSVIFDDKTETMTVVTSK